MVGFHRAREVDELLRVLAVDGRRVAGTGKPEQRTRVANPLPRIAHDPEAEHRAKLLAGERLLGANFLEQRQQDPDREADTGDFCLRRDPPRIPPDGLDIEPLTDEQEPPEPRGLLGVAKLDPGPLQFPDEASRDPLRAEHMLGEHGYLCGFKPQGDRAAMQVPFIVRYPERIQGGRRVDGLFDVGIDTPVTLIELVGAERLSEAHGISFLDLLDGTARMCVIMSCSRLFG